MRFSDINLAKAVLATGAVALFAASCGSNSDDSGSTASDTASNSGPVSVASVQGVDVLTNADGHTLYSATAEKGGTIKCVDACTSFWVPLQASASAVKTADSQVRADLGTVKRPDGESQLTYSGMPLYTFAQEGADELQGDGFTDDFQGTHFIWKAATTGASAVPSPSDSSTPDDSSGGGYGY
jgi:predicted lipoprotein with Yx(FWY)xxD motif